MANSRHPMVHTGEKAAGSTFTSREKYRERRTVATAQGCHENLEVETELGILDWYAGGAVEHVFDVLTKILVTGFFFLGDSLNTTVIVVATLQSEVQHYNTILLAELLMVSYAAQCVGMFVFMRVQNRWRISTKTMLNAIAVFIIILDCWGMIGVWTQKIGFHNSWEFWLYQVWYGLLVCPWYSYSQTMVRQFREKKPHFAGVFSSGGG